MRYQNTKAMCYFSNTVRVTGQAVPASELRRTGKIALAPPTDDPYYRTAVAYKIDLLYVLGLASTAALGGLLFGFDVAIISGAGPFLVHYFQLGDLSLSAAFSSLLVGCVLGAAFAGRITDRYGRRIVLLAVAALFAITSVATGLAWSFQSFVAARFLGGLAVGAVSLVSPMYIAEIAQPRLRGRLGTLYQLSIVTGILVSDSINYLLRSLGPKRFADSDHSAVWLAPERDHSASTLKT